MKAKNKIGRKRKYGKATTIVVAFRIPVNAKIEIKEQVRTALRKYERSEQSKQ